MAAAPLSRSASNDQPPRGVDGGVLERVKAQASTVIPVISLTLENYHLAQIVP